MLGPRAPRIIPLGQSKAPDECKNRFRLEAIKVSAFRRPLKYQKSLLGIVLSLGVPGVFCSLPRLFKREGDVVDIPLNGVLVYMPLRACLGGLVKRVFYVEDYVVPKTFDVPAICICPASSPRIITLIRRTFLAGLPTLISLGRNGVLTRISSLVSHRFSVVRVKCKRTVSPLDCS
jgi:hypothetical protein